MKRLTYFSLVLFALVITPACLSSTPKEEHFYHLTGPTVPLEKGTGPTLEVLPFHAAAGYDTARLAYRVSSHELRFYAHHKWAAQPSVIVREMVGNHLRASGEFAMVGVGAKGMDPDGFLSGTLVALEEIDMGDSWKARLALRIELRLGKSDEVLMRHGFDVTMPCKERHPREVAAAMSEALTKEMKALAPRLAQAIRAATSVTPPVAEPSPAVPQPTPAPVEDVEDASAGD